MTTAGLSFCAAMWADAAGVRHDIERHPFVSGLLDGTLPRPVFDYYVEQDTHYLTGYEAALRACAAQADGIVSRSFWADAARDTVEVEALLREEYLHGRPLPDRSRPCTEYVQFLGDLAGGAGLAVLAAAVLPCFWIFSDLGRYVADLDLRGHRFADWVGTYRDPRFAAATARARALVDDLAAGSAPSVRTAMQQAFRRACRYERLLFDDAWAAGATTAPEPLLRPANGSASASATTNEVSEADSHG